jgi:hypothetical protein
MISPFYSFIVILSFGFMIASCGNSENMPGSGMSGSEMQTLSKGAMTGTDAEASEHVIRDQASFRSFWNELSGEFVNDGNVPEVDFDTFMVIGVMMGQKPSSGYDISIESASVQEDEDEDTLQLSVVRTEPGPNCMNMTVITHPHHIIKIRKYEGDVAFEYETVVEECN